MVRISLRLELKTSKASTVAMVTAKFAIMMTAKLIDDATVRTRRDWKTFAKAIQVGTEDLAKNKEKIDAGGDPTYQWIDLAEARSQGIMPIPYSAAP